MLLLAYASNHEDLDVKYKFTQFVEQYKKEYSSPEEFGDRLKVFAQNLREIENHNARKDNTWTKGINQFTDLTGLYSKNLTECSINILLLISSSL